MVTMANDLLVCVNEKCPHLKLIFVVEGHLNLVISDTAIITTSTEKDFY
jgi:hypothetical protein